MAEPVNLNRFKKDKARAMRKARAQQNVVKFGRSKAEKQLDRAQADKAQSDFDGHKRDK